MAMRVEEDEAKAGAPEWVVTFGDMMSLLLCFFILILSFSTIEVEKFKSLAGMLREAFNLGTLENSAKLDMTEMPITDDDPMPRTTPSDDFIKLQLAREALEKAKLGSKGHVRITDRGVAIRVDGDAAFRSGSIDLTEEVRRLLDEVAVIVSSQPGTIEVEGHTDDIPIASSRFPSNWELSSARAGTAARYLAEKGVPTSRIKAIGYADTRPLVPNSSPENRVRNRRVEILITGERSKRKILTLSEHENEFVPGSFSRDLLVTPEAQENPAESDKEP
jgi:chemotaxis protein MotB